MRNPFGLFSFIEAKFHEAKTSTEKFFEDKQKEIDAGIKKLFKVEEPSTSQQKTASDSVSSEATTAWASSVQTKDSRVAKFTAGSQPPSATASTKPVTASTKPGAQIMPTPTSSNGFSATREEGPRYLFDRLSKPGIDSQILTGNDSSASKNYLRKKITFWSKELDAKQINPSIATISQSDEKGTYLVTYAKFLSENIQGTRAESKRNPTNENYLALLSAQELELAKMCYICCPGVDDRSSNTNSKQQKIYNFLSPEVKNYATRQSERKLKTDYSMESGFNLSAETNFITGIEVPQRQFSPSNFTNSYSQGYNGGSTIQYGGSRSDKLDKLSSNIEKLHEQSKTALEQTRSARARNPTPAPSTITITNSAINLVNGIQKLGDGSEAEKLREKIKTPYATYAPEVDRALNQKLIIGKNSIERRMANIEKSLFGIDNGRTFNTSDALSETPNEKENALIEYVGFLQDKISLVKKEIKIAENDKSEQGGYKKLKLQRLQFGLFGEIGKIRGLFPKMSQGEKQDEALKLKESIRDFGKIDTSQGRVYARGPGGNGEILFKISPSTRDSVDKKIESIVRSVNKEERLLERDVGITQRLGIEPRKGLLTQKPRRIGQGTIFRPTTDSGGR
jgi:hypothetical protein